MAARCSSSPPVSLSCIMDETVLPFQTRVAQFMICISRFNHRLLLVPIFIRGSLGSASHLQLADLQDAKRTRNIIHQVPFCSARSLDILVVLTSGTSRSLSSTFNKQVCFGGIICVFFVMAQFIPTVRQTKRRTFRR